jgi:hypothetical protein
MNQSSEFCRHNPLCCFSMSNIKRKCIFRYRLSPQTFGFALVLKMQNGEKWGHWSIESLLDYRGFWQCNNTWISVLEVRGSDLGTEADLSFVSFLSPSCWMPLYYIQISHDSFLLNPFKFSEYDHFNVSFEAELRLEWIARRWIITIIHVFNVWYSSD